MCPFKNELVNFCCQILEEKAAAYREAMDTARDAQQGDSKSSAGDKYETTREMMTLEIEQHSVHLATVLEQMKQWQQIPFGQQHETVEAGALLQTNLGRFLIGVGLGAVTFRGERVMVFSSSAPAAKLLTGKRKGDEVNLNGKTLTILEIC